MTDLATHATAYVNGSKSSWEQLVDLALALSDRQINKASERLAALTHTSKKTMRTKILAIRFQNVCGASAEQIKSVGQEKALGSWVKGKVKARTLPLVNFPHRLTPPVRDALHEAVLRIGRVCQLKTYDEVFQFIIAQIDVATDLELLHSAGEAHGSNTRNERSTRSGGMDVRQRSPLPRVRSADRMVGNPDREEDADGGQGNS